MPDEKSIQSMGGDARAKALTPEQRSESARNAALAKWEKSPTAKKIPKATHEDRPVKIGDIEIPCAVLEGGIRVISERAVTRALGGKRGGSHWLRMKENPHGAILPVYLSANNLKPFIDNNLIEALKPLNYRPLSGGTAYGLRAELLPKICNVLLRARDVGALHDKQKGIAIQADILIRGLAEVGIIALIDEATGYQDVRDRQALQEILKKYVDGELYKWTETFPLQLYKEIFRLKGWAWNNGKMPQVVGHYTNDLVYDRLTKGMLEELKRLSPKDEAGRRKHRFYKFLTPEVGYPALNQRLYELLGMARASTTWEQFYRLVDRTFERMGDTPRLPFSEDV